MKKAYCAISYNSRQNYNEEIQVINDLFSQQDIELFVFVDHYRFKKDEEKEMMATAFNEIESCDFLIAELSTKAIGVGIEIGYAYAKKKPILYLRKENAEYSTTTAGCTTYHIAYKNSHDLIEQLQTVIHSIIKV